MMTVTTGTQGPLPHISPCTEAFWNMSVRQTISWKHLRPQKNGLNIQVPLHVTCVLKQTNSLICSRQGQSSGASCWQCCVGHERSPEEQTPSATALVFQPKQLLLFFWGWVAFLQLFPSAKCWRALKCHTTTVLNAAPFCVFRKPGLDILKGAKNKPQTCGDNTASAHNCECLQAYCKEFLAWVGKGKKRWGTLLSGKLTDVVAALHLWLFWDPSFYLSCAQPKTYDPLQCCFSLSIRQALKKTFRISVEIISWCSSGSLFQSDRQLWFALCFSLSYEDCKLPDDQMM